MYSCVCSVSAESANFSAKRRYSEYLSSFSWDMVFQPIPLTARLPAVTAAAMEVTTTRWVRRRR